MRKAVVLALFFLSVFTAIAQNRTITGRITSDRGVGLANVSVVVKSNPSIGTTTDNIGNFTLAVPASATALVLTAVGYQTAEVPLGNSNSVSMALTAAVRAEEEVIVVAYGTARRQSYTGSATVVKAEDIGKQQISNLSKSLEGLVPGLKVTTGSGQPGAGTDIRIRGIGSISASQAPLFVVDGVPYGGDINAINPTDIESISVLKDAASAALYGARGSNGVILVTTKKGRGRPRIEVQARYGINSRALPEYDVIRDPKAFLEVYWQSLRNEAMNRSTNPLSDAAARSYASNNLISKLGGYNPYNVGNTQLIDPATGLLNPAAQLRYQDDWQKEMFESRPRQEYVGTLSGSNDKTQYYMSFGYLNDKGYIVRSDFTRINGRLNLIQEVNNWFRMGLNASFANSSQNTTNEGNTAYQNAFYFTRNVAPIYPVYLRDAQGNFVYDAMGKRQYDFGNGVMGTRQFAATENPRGTLDYDIYRYKADNLSARTFAEAKFLRDFRFTFNYGLDLTNYGDISFQNPLYGNAAGANGRGTVDQGRNLTTNINQLLNYNRRFGDHGVEALLGHESYNFRTTFLFGSKENFLDPSNPQLGNGVSIQALGSSDDEYNVEGYFSQVRYDYRNKYLLSGSVRRDGSSRFAPENRWGTFYSVGAGYVISQEDFMRRFTWLNNLKLKASYGVRGNDALTSGLNATQNFYPYLDQYTIVNNNGQIGITQTYKGNRDITWEKNQDLDVGLDFRVFNRISGTFDYFRRKITDLLFNVPQAISTGITAVPLNVGSMENWGYEAEIQATLVKSRNLTIELGLNGTHVKNRITKLADINREQGIITGNFKYLEGKSIYEFFTWKYAGVDAATGRSLWYKDEMENGKPTGKQIVTPVASEGTQYYTGKTAFNDLYGGADLSVKFKNIDFSLLTSYAIGGYVYDAPYQSLMYGGGGVVSTWHKDIEKRWQKPGDVTDVPKVQDLYQDANAVSDRWLVDASYFQIRNVVLGYTLPEKWLNRWSIGATRIYVAADNVGLFGARRGLDPRQTFTGTINNAYAPIRTISFGINSSF